MFEIAKTPSETDLPIIATDYQDVLFDEIPVLFFGVNSQGNRIIGSSLDEDYRQGFERYLHIVVSDEDFDLYIERNVSYRTLINRAATVYVIDKYVQTDECKIYEMTVSEIPESHLPTTDTFYPSKFAITAKG